MNDAMALLVFPAFLAVIVSVIVVGAVVIVLVVWPAIAVDALVHHAQDVGRDLEASLGQFGQVVGNLAIIYGVLIPGHVVLLHVVADEGGQLAFFFSFGHLASFLDEHFQRTPVVSVANLGAWVGDGFRLGVQPVL